MKTKACLSVVTLSLIALVLMCGLGASAQNQVAQQPTTSSVPNLIRYGGVLKDADGAVLASQTVGITFALYKQQDGGVALWTETRNVTTDAAGQYNVMLGSTKSEGVPAELFSDQEQRYLAVQVQGQPEPTRVLLVSVPYAFRAHEAETLGGLPASAFVKAPTDATNGGSAGGGLTVNTLGATGNLGSSLQAKGTGKILPPGPCLPVFGYITYWDITGALCASKLFQAPGGNIGIGLGPTNPPSKALDVGGAGPNGGVINARKWYDLGKPETRILSVTTNPIFPNPVSFPNSTNLFIGWSAAGLDGGPPQSNGTGNTFTGFQSGFLNNPPPSPKVSGNTYNGTNTGYFNLSGSQNTFTGYQAGYFNTTDNNSCFGFAACEETTSGTQNVAVGAAAGLRNSTGSRNTYVGFDSAFGVGPGQETGNDNTFTGWESGFKNTGNQNTFSGSQAGSNNATDGNSFYGYQAGFTNNVGAANTFVGLNAGFANMDAGGNTYVGSNAGQFAGGLPGSGCCNTFVGDVAGQGSSGNTTGGGNTFLGYRVGQSITTGGKNTFSGWFSGQQHTTGSFNSFYGDQSGQLSIDGNYNTFLGISAAGSYFTTGDNNTCVGAFACDSENNVYNNIEIGNYGLAPEVGTQPTCVPSAPCPNQIYIGTLDLQVDTYVQGIYNSVPGTQFPWQTVCVDPFGKLWGDQLFGFHACGGFSSRRFKDQIADMGDSSSRLFQLRPVSFFYKTQYDDGSHRLQYGLIAEEVAKVYPEMVAYDKDGQPFRVNYDALAPLLLNEVQKQHAVVTAQQDQMQALREQTKAQQQQMLAQQQEIEGLKSQLQLQNAAFQERLSRLESLVTTQMQTALADKTAQLTHTGGLQ